MWFEQWYLQGYLMCSVLWLASGITQLSLSLSIYLMCVFDGGRGEHCTTNGDGTNSNSHGSERASQCLRHEQLGHGRSHTWSLQGVESSYFGKSCWYHKRRACCQCVSKCSSSTLSAFYTLVSYPELGFWVCCAPCFIFHHSLMWITASHFFPVRHILIGRRLETLQERLG